MPIRVSESVLASIIGISSDAVICANAEQRVTFFNDGAARLFGYASSEVIGQPLEMLLPDSARAAHAGHMARFGRSPVTARRMGERQQIAGRRKNGTEFPAEAAIAHSGTGEKAVFSVVLRDITERRRAEARQQFLVDASERLAASIELAEIRELTSAIWVPEFGVAAVVDTGGDELTLCTQAGAPGAGTVRVTSIARQGDGSFAVDRDPAAHLDGFTAAAVADLATDAGAAITALEPHLVVRLPLIARAQQLGVIRLFRQDTLERDDVALAEQIAGRAAMAIDNARLHDAVQRAVRTRDETMNIVSHDLRNPANAIKMLAGAVLADDVRAALPPEVVEHVTVIRRAAVQMDALIQDLLDASRAEAGRLGIRPQRVSASPLLSSGLDTVAPLAIDRGITIREEIPAGLPEIVADPERVMQVLSNVVGNAIKFTPRDGEIVIGAVVDGRFVRVSVADSGPGITAEQMPRVFERYWQGNRASGGTGLGLPIARGIVEAHGGRIWAEERRATGAVFHFTLPVAAD